MCGLGQLSLALVITLTDSIKGNVLCLELNVYRRNLKNYIKLDTDVEIRINANMRTEKKVIEKGFDKEKGMHYYKIYFNNEE